MDPRPKKKLPEGRKPMLDPKFIRAALPSGDEHELEDESLEMNESSGLPFASFDGIKTIFEYDDDEPEPEQIRFGCSKCMHSLKAPAELIGQKVRCPACFIELIVPKISRIEVVPEDDLYAVDLTPVDVREMSHREMPASFSCPVCKAHIGVRREQAGDTMECPDCHSEITVPLEIIDVARQQLEKKLDGIMDGLDVPDDLYDLVAPSKEKYDPEAEKARLDNEKDRLAVYCDLCGTLMYSDIFHIGEKLKCPDCGTLTPVRKPLEKIEPEKHVTSNFEGTNQYGLHAPNLKTTAYLAGNPAAEGDDSYSLETKSTFRASQAISRTQNLHNTQNQLDPQSPESKKTDDNLVPVVCSLCGTRMYAEETQIGMTKQCPDCGRETMIIRPTAGLEAGGAAIDAYGIGKVEAVRPNIREVHDYRYLEGALDKDYVDREAEIERAKVARKGEGRKAGNSGGAVRKRPPQSVESEQKVRANTRSTTPEHRAEAEEVDLETIRRRRLERLEKEERQGGGKERSDGELLYQHPKPPEFPLTGGIFKPFVLPEFIIRIVTILIGGVIYFALLAAALPFVIAVANGYGSYGEAIFCVVLGCGCLFAGLVWFTFLANCCLSIFGETTGGSDECTDWAEYTVPVGIVNLVWVLLPGLAAAAPGYGLWFAFAPANVTSPEYTITFFAFIAVSHWFFYPFAFLASMESGIPFPLFARNTFAGLRQVPGVWLRFVLLAIPLYLCPVALFGLGMLLGLPHDSILINMFYFCFGGLLFNLCVIIYYRMLGRLAWVIEDAIRVVSG